MAKGNAGVLAWILFALTAVAESAAAVLSWGLEPAYDTIIFAGYALAMAATGALIADRHPGNPIGWLFCGFALLNAVTSDFAQGYGLRAAERGWPGGSIAEWVAMTSWLLSGFGWILTFVLFPDGRLPGRRWRAVPWIGALGLTLAMLGWSLSADRVDEFTAGRNPFAVPWLPTDALLGVGMALYVGALLASTLSLVSRFRHATAELRQQLKWVAAAAAFAAVALPASFALWYVTPLAAGLAALALIGLPVAAGVAILHFRLYDIDVVVDRTVVYGSVSVLLAAGYAAVTLILGAWLGGGSGWVTAAATLAVAVAFRPFRDRVQDLVDRHFHRARYTAVRGMVDFLERVRAGDAAPDEVQAVIRELTGDPDLRLFLFLPQSQLYVDHAGGPADLPRVPDPPDGRVVVERGGRSIGVVVPGSSRPPAPALLRDLVESGGLAIEIRRLDVELRRQLDQVAASRARIVTAAFEERRRLERDLHDGAQQRLVSIGLALRHAQHQLRGDRSSAAIATLDEAVHEVTLAIDELRELVRGLPPAQLDSGLGPAFRDLARRAPVPVELTAPAGRFGRDIEGAAYFIGCEGITNAVKHAHASHITLAAGRENDRLVVVVTDDGIGGATPAGGSGLAGLADRVAAVGGVLQIESRPGVGTRLTAELPCGL